MKSFNTIIVTIGFMLVAQHTIAKDTTTHGLRTQHNKRLNKHKQKNNNNNIVETSESSAGLEEDVEFFTNLNYRKLQAPIETPNPTELPPVVGTPAPTSGSTPTVGTNKTLAPTPGVVRPIAPPPITPFPTEGIVAPSPVAPPSMLVTKSGLDGEVDEVQQAYGNIIPNKSNGSRSSGKSGKGSSKSGKASSGKSSKGSSKSSKGSSGSGGYSRRQY